MFPSRDGGAPAWTGGYAALPHPLPLDDDESDRSRVRVFFSGRDRAQRSSIGAVTVDLETALPVPGTATPRPLLSPGSLGAFDDSGVTTACIVPHGGRLHLYYTGWMLGRSVPFYFAIGLALSDDGGRSFRRHSAAPILDRHQHDPFLSASPSVLIEDGLWRMWYVSGERWERRPGGPRHHYLLRYAESGDGIHWHRDGRVALGFAGAGEYAIGRPSVTKTQSGYRMWFCSRGDRYRVGVAHSTDGLDWEREPEGVAFAPPPEEDGWDAEMQAYPAVFSERDRWWMLYNGNGYGATGFGLAMAEAPARGDAP